MNPIPSTELLSQSIEEELVPALVRIPGGWFFMGCATGQDNEKPVHRVWVDEFLLAPCQVTNSDYGRFLRDTASPPPPFWTDPAFNHPEQPVVGVSWHEAARYCEWLTARMHTDAHIGTDALVRPAERSSAAACSETKSSADQNASAGKTFRLATEAEWECAARGGRDSALFPWGDAPPQSLPDYAARCDAYWKSGPEPVGRAEANGYGVYNMCDNVHEWCSDWYAADYYAVSPERNPQGPESGVRRASRGGSWRHHIKMSRCAARSSIPPEFQYADYGFRVACDVVIGAPLQSPEPQA
jgi:sulfatase modifying factor 1